MFCSTIIPTVGRPSLSRAVESLLQQEIPGERFEIIVVNDSGSALPEEEWQQSELVKVISTNKRERSNARNTGAAIARGDYLHFLDDDDWLAPGALNQLFALAKGSQAVWFYGISQLVDRQGRPLLKLHHQLSGNCFLQTMAGEWIPLQASLIDAHAFFEVGGFNTRITVTEDIDLLRRVTLIGDIAESAHLIAFIARGETGSTTDYAQHSRASRWAREMILDGPGVFSRLRGSACSSTWHGRALRIYLTSALWNLRRRRLASLASRLLFGLTSLGLAGPRALSVAFWRAVFTDYHSETFARGIAKANDLF